MEPSMQKLNKMFEVIHDGTANWYLGVFINAYENDNGLFEERYILRREKDIGDPIMFGRIEFLYDCLNDAMSDFYYHKENLRSGRY